MLHDVWQIRKTLYTDMYVNCIRSYVYICIMIVYINFIFICLEKYIYLPILYIIINYNINIIYAWTCYLIEFRLNIFIFARLWLIFVLMIIWWLMSVRHILFIILSYFNNQNYPRNVLLAFISIFKFVLCYSKILKFNFLFSLVCVLFSFFYVYEHFKLKYVCKFEHIY